VAMLEKIRDLLKKERTGRSAHENFGMPVGPDVREAGGGSG